MYKILCQIISHVLIREECTSKRTVLSQIEQSIGKQYNGIERT